MNSGFPTGLTSASAPETRRDGFPLRRRVDAIRVTGARGRSQQHLQDKDGASMDEFGTTAGVSGDPVPDQLRSLFNHPDNVRVQELPCALPGFGSLAVHFGAGARTVPHQHHNGQHLVFVEGIGVVADEDGVHVVGVGDVVSNPPGAWHWHGATPGAAATHVTFEAPGDFDLDVERRDWDDTYGPDLGT